MLTLVYLPLYGISNHYGELVCFQFCWGLHARIRSRSWSGRITFRVCGRSSFNCGSSPPEGRFIFTNHFSISGSWPGGGISPAAPHPQPPVSIGQRVFCASALEARFSLLKGQPLYVCNVWQKTPRAVCLFIFQFQNVIMLFCE